jgi:Flp pilus assembly protein CpaB
LIVHRRQALPGSRAVVGGFLVAAAAVGIFAAYAGAQHRGQAQYVVAAHDLAVGTRLKPADLATVTLDLPQSSRGHAFMEAGWLDGSLVIGPVAKGELLQPGSVLAAGKPPPFREVTVAVDAQQVGGVAQGDTVDVLVTTGANESTRTDVVVGGARVLRIGDRPGGIGGDAKPPVTFALQTFDDVTRIVQASHVGSLTMVRANGFGSQPVTFSPSQSAAGNH